MAHPQLVLSVLGHEERDEASQEGLAAVQSHVVLALGRLGLVAHLVAVLPPGKPVVHRPGQGHHERAVQKLPWVGGHTVD